MITDTDILSGIRDAGPGPWATVELDDACPPVTDGAAGLQAHFGVVLRAEELGQLTTVRSLVDLLRRKFDEE